MKHVPSTVSDEESVNHEFRVWKGDKRFSLETIVGAQQLDMEQVRSLITMYV